MTRLEPRARRIVKKSSTRSRKLAPKQVSVTYKLDSLTDRMQLQGGEARIAENAQFIYTSAPDEREVCPKVEDIHLPPTSPAQGESVQIGQIPLN